MLFRSAKGDMCTHPVSGIRCKDGIAVSVDNLRLLKGNYVEFVIVGGNLNRTQNITLEVSGHHLGSRWSMTRSTLQTKNVRILIPSGLVAFRASQPSRNGILPSFRNLSISPKFLNVRPLATQRVLIRIDTRRQ